MVGHIKGRIKRSIDFLRNHVLSVPHAFDFFGVSHLDRDPFSRLHLGIDRRRRRTDIERHAIMPGQNGKAGGSDLVGGISVCCHTVTADKDDLDPPRLQQKGCHVIALHTGRDAGIPQLKRGEHGSLQKRSRFIAINMHIPSLPAMLQCDIHRRSRRSVFGGCKRPRIAVREDAQLLPFLLALLKQLKTNFADVP